MPSGQGSLQQGQQKGRHHLCRHEQEASFCLLNDRYPAVQQGITQPPGDHRVLWLRAGKFGDALLPGLLVPGLAWALEGAHDDGGIGPCCVLEEPSPTCAGWATAPACNSTAILQCESQRLQSHCHNNDCLGWTELAVVVCVL